MSRLTEAREAYRVADKAEQAAWGPLDGYHAKPRAIQLAARIEVGEELLRRSPGAKGIVSGLGQLRTALASAKESEADRARCKAWQDAYDRWYGALCEVVTAERLEHATVEPVQERFADVWVLPGSPLHWPGGHVPQAGHQGAVHAQLCE